MLSRTCQGLCQMKRKLLLQNSSFIAEKLCNFTKNWTMLETAWQLHLICVKFLSCFAHPSMLPITAVLYTAYYAISLCIRHNHSQEWWNAKKGGHPPFHVAGVENKKDSNMIVSVVQYFLKKKAKKELIDKTAFKLFADSAFGQNKNLNMMSMLMALKRQLIFLNIQ